MEKGKTMMVTPKKIQRLLHIAEDSSYRQQQDNGSARVLVQTNPCESSSGLLDLDNIEAMETIKESTDHLHLQEKLQRDSVEINNWFNPGEMTGRSTGTEDVMSNTMRLSHHNVAVKVMCHGITQNMNKQTAEVQDLMRYSIGNTTYSFQSKRDLTADERSLMMREAPLPIPHTAQTQFLDSVGTNNSALSVGAYFQKRCSGFEAGLGKNDSPDRSMYSMPSISEVNTPKPNYIDESLDCVPVRQSRLELPEKLNLNNTTMPKNYDKQKFQPIANKFENYVTNKTFNTGPNYSSSSISNAPEPHLHYPKPVASSSFMSVQQALSEKHTEALVKTGVRVTTQETEEESGCPTENSISISKIADFLASKESNVSVSAIIQYNKQKNHPKKKPISQLAINYDGKSSQGTHLTSLSETRKLDTASSAGTISTVIPADIQKGPDLPAIVVYDSSILQAEGLKDVRQSTRSKSSSSKSQSTLSTVHENYNSFKSGDSPLQTSKGDVNNTRVPSPNIEYRELDKSVDWHDLLQQKRHKQQSLAKAAVPIRKTKWNFCLSEEWAEIVATTCTGFVGVSYAVNCTITTLTDSWLTAKLKFDIPTDGEDIIIEPPRLPLLSPGKTEKFTFYITSNIELDTSIPFTMYLKDSSIDLEVEQKGSFDIHIKMPMIQAMSSDELNKLTFPPIQETCSLFKSFVLVSDCSADLQLELSIAKGDKFFSIISAQEIVKSDVNKALMERQGSVEEIQMGKGKTKGKNKQPCKLSNGNAITVTVNFNAPKLSEHQIEGNIATFSGGLNVKLIGANTVLRKVDLIGTAGTVDLVLNVPGDELHLTSDPSNLTLSNTGSVNGVWVVKVANTSPDRVPFKVAPYKFDIRPGASKDITLSYTGPEDCENSAILIFEDLITYHKIVLKITGGTETPKSFPIKTNYSVISFVRPDKQEINLKNSSNKKLQVKLMIKGEGFYLDLPGMQDKSIYLMAFAPSECRNVTVVFDPASNMPYAAYLHLTYEKNNDLSRKVRLYGCSSGESADWAGLLTYKDMALVRAARRQPVKLELYNKSTAPAFVAAKAQFHLQYNAVEATAQLTGNKRVLGGRTRHSLSLVLDWSRMERCARKADTGAFATVTVLTGSEFTRRRILKIIRDESSGVLDTSLLADHLKVLADNFEGEDPDIDNMITDFEEIKGSLTELIGGLRQLTAQVVLSQDHENTALVIDDTVVHHTLCD